MDLKKVAPRSFSAASVRGLLRSANHTGSQISVDHHGKGSNPIQVSVERRYDVLIDRHTTSPKLGPIRELLDRFYVVSRVEEEQGRYSYIYLTSAREVPNV